MLVLILIVSLTGVCAGITTSIKQYRTAYECLWFTLVRLSKHCFLRHRAYSDKPLLTVPVCHLSQGDLRFVMTVKGSRILLSVKSAAEELEPVLAEAKEFSLLSFKVTCIMRM